ncbi:hypothetical protein P389DRAFT_193814 [Cystobasidium minutum MCA 4210]|uniref:uncharacterized protein n=1 Tax=Cystobasidium minutum MCA 4210 TaxID=1397322 RepID=UPI0034CE7C04|eukprot:jgi/Rhomi1/193814/gm1.2028_g
MATYDLDRWSKSLRKRHHGEASLTLHLHPHHCRFEHQNGVFLYDSPIRGLLESIRDARLPVELLDLLDATAVKYFEGCLVVEVIDHRAVVADGTGEAGGNNDSNSSNLPGGDAANASAIGSSHARSGSLAGGGSLVDSRRGSRSIQSARAADGSILKSSMSLSMNDANDPNAAAFHKRFMTSYKRFELALQEAAGLKATQVMRDKRAEEQRKQREQQAQQTSSQNNAPNGHGQEGDQNKENESMNASSIHSAIAAAVATATSMTATNGDASNDEDALSRTRPLVYRIVLGPDIETVWTDLLAMREEKRAKWSEEDLLAMESRILALTTPPLCLSPDMQVSRIANTLLDATSLPITPSIPTRKREAPLQPIKAALPKSAKRSKKGVDKAEKEAAEKQEEEDEQQARVEAQEAAEREEDEAWMRVMDDSQASRLAFQPSFSRLAFVQNWREKKSAEEERVRRLAAEAAAAQAQAEIDAREAAKAARLASKNNSRQGSVSQSRQGSVIDIPVNASTPAPNNTSFPASKTEDLSMDAQQQQILPKKKKTNKNKDKNAAGRAGSPPNANTSATDLGASTSSAPVSLKFTLPGKKKKDKNANKAGSPDIAVNPSPPPSASTPVQVSTISATTSTPTAAQQAIMRKTANLPKAKLKSDVKAQVQAQAAAQAQVQQQMQNANAGVQQNNQINGSPVSQQGTPQMQNQVQQMNQQPIRPSSTNPQMNLPIQPQRNFVSPGQGNQPNMNQFTGGQQGNPMAAMQAGQPLNVEQTQEYVNQLSAQIAQYQQAAQQQQQQQSNQANRTNMNFNNLSGSPFPQNMQIQNQQHGMPQNQFPTQPPQSGNTGPMPQNFPNIHRSPVYGNAALPQQQAPGMQTPQPQHQFIPYNNNTGSPANAAAMSQQAQFTPQQAFQLQQLQQSQQNMFSQHSQNLANFGQQQNNNMQQQQQPNMNFNMGAYNAQQQGQQPFGQQAMQNMSNMPNINLQGMQMNPQFNSALLSQLQRQQQSQQAPMGMQNYNQMQNQWQGQQ